MRPATTPEDTVLESLLRARDIPCTPRRAAIWRFFTDHPQGYTIGDAVETLREHGIGQATVYRTVFLLLDLGLLTRFQHPAGKTYFVATRPGHTHPLICRDCREIVEFDSCDLSVLEKLLTAETGYAIDTHRLEVYGRCPRCQAQSAPREDQHVHHDTGSRVG